MIKNLNINNINNRNIYNSIKIKNNISGSFKNTIK